MKRYFTTKSLADMRLAGQPTTAQGWDKLVKNQEWEFIEAHGRGRGGLRREYVPPPSIMALIQPFLEENPGFFENSKARKGAFHMPVRSEAEQAASRLHTKALFNTDRIEHEIKTSFGDAPAHYAQNPNADFEVLLKRLGEATQATVRISKQFDCPLPTEWTSLIQELMAMHGLTETGAKRVIDELLKAHAR